MSQHRLPTLDGVLYLDLDSKRVSIHDEGGSVIGARASVETAGQIEKQITAARVLFTGVFALAWQKQKDARELYMLVEGADFSMVARIHPNHSASARRFASYITTAGKGGDPSAGLEALQNERDNASRAASRKVMISSYISLVILLAVVIAVIYIVFIVLSHK